MSSGAEYLCIATIVYLIYTGHGIELLEDLMLQTFVFSMVCLYILNNFLSIKYFQRSISMSFFHGDRKQQLFTGGLNTYRSPVYRA